VGNKFSLLGDNEVKKVKTIKKKESPLCIPITDEAILVEKSKHIFENKLENDKFLEYIKPYVNKENIVIFTKSLIDQSFDKKEEDRS